MIFWIAATALATAVTALFVQVLLRHRGAARARADYDIAVYRDQLEGVESDLARGVITDDAAERLRTEISRRILDADRGRGAEDTRRAPPALTYAAAALGAVLLTGGSLALYATLGAPGYGDLPLQARLENSEELRRSRPSQDAAEAEMAAAALPRQGIEPDEQFLALMDRLRETLEERPNDPRGLELLARNEAAMGNFAAAHEAQARLIEVRGAEATADDYAGLAEMLVLAAGGYVSPEAEAALGRALTRDPQNGPARYYLGLMQSQNDRPDRAFDIWRELLEASRPNAPWVPAIRGQITDVAARAGVNYQPPAPAGAAPGPSAADLDAAQDMAPEQRMQMVRGMVEGLSDRLASQGGSPDEWARLIGALSVLGERDRAEAIHAEAQQVFANNAAALEQVNAAARQAGIGQ